MVLASTPDAIALDKLAEVVNKIIEVATLSLLHLWTHPCCSGTGGVSWERQDERHLD